MKTLVIFLFLFAHTVCHSQQACAAYGNGDGEPAYFREVLSISVSPLALLDVYNGSSYKAGISIQPINALWFTADFGRYWSGFSSIMSPWDNVEGYNFRTSAGINWGTMSPFGIGLEYEYKKASFTYFDSLPDLPGFTASVNKFVHVFNIYGSYKVDLSQHFFLDLRVNLGVRYRDISNDHSDELNNSVFWWDSMNTGKLTNKQSLMPNLNFALRLNYVLWQSWR